MSDDKSEVVLPKGWRTKTISEIADDGLFVDGDWVESKDQDPSGTVRLTQLADVGEGEFRNKSDRWMRVDQALKVGVTYLEEGDLLVARMPDPLGRCCLVPKLENPSVTVVDVAILRIDAQKAVSKFVMWALNSPDIRLAMGKISSGTTRTRISRKNLGTIEIPFPPIDEQEKVVEILEEQLSRLDAALASVRVVRTKAARVRRSRLHAAFTGALTGHGASAGALPEGWAEKPLSELCAPGKDSIVDGPFGSNLKRSDFLDSGVPVLKLQNIKPNMIIQKNMDFVSPAKFETLMRHSFRLGDVVMTKLGNPLGVSAIVTDIEHGVIVADLVRVRPANIDTKFLCYQLNSPLVSKFINENQKGTTRPRINLSIVRNLKLNVPRLAEQQKIVEILEEQLSRLDASLALADVIEKKTSGLRRSLLHAAFTGELTKQWREDAHV